VPIGADLLSTEVWVYKKLEHPEPPPVWRSHLMSDMLALIFCWASIFQMWVSLFLVVKNLNVLKQILPSMLVCAVILIGLNNADYLDINRLYFRSPDTRQF